MTTSRYSPPYHWSWVNIHCQEYPSKYNPTLSWDEGRCKLLDCTWAAYPFLRRSPTFFVLHMRADMREYSSKGLGGMP